MDKSTTSDNYKTNKTNTKGETTTKLKKLTSRMSYPNGVGEDKAPKGKRPRVGTSNNNVASERKSSLRSSRVTVGKVSRSSLRASSIVSKLKFGSKDKPSQKDCVEKFHATFSQWDGKTSLQEKPGRETSFGIFRRCHVRAHKRIRDTYDPMNYYFCAIE